MPKEYSDTSRLIKDILRLDEQLIGLLARRARLLKEALGQPGRKDHALDPELEKALWKSWEAAVPPAKRDTRLWRTLFTLVQELPPGDADLAGSADPEHDAPGFLLTPRPSMTEIRAQGPMAHREDCCRLALAAQAKEPFTLPGAVLNDPLVALIKGLNQAGASMHWDENSVMGRGGANLAFAGKVIYAGDSPLALNILLALALSDPGRTRFAGGPALKLTDISKLTAFFPKLGTRLSQVIPGSRGLPARMEASAVLPPEVTLPPDYPEEAALALALAAPSFEHGLTLAWDESAPFGDLFAALAPILAEWSVNCEISGRSLRVEPGTPAPPQAEQFDSRPMDPLLGAWLLSLPLFVGLQGKKTPRCRVEGLWPRERHPWDRLAALLSAAGLSLNLDDKGAASTLPGSAATDKTAVTLDTGRIPSYFPFSVALGSALARQGRQVRVSAPAEPEQMGICAEYLERLGLAPVEQGSWLGIKRAESAPELKDLAPWLSPDPEWTLAYALAGFLRPGLTLANPGGVTELMPGFWALFNGLPEPPRIQARPRSTKKDVDDDAKSKPKGRRIKL